MIITKKIQTALFIIAILGLMAPSISHAGFFDELKQGAESLRRGAEDIKATVLSTKEVKKIAGEITSYQDANVANYNNNPGMVRQAQSNLKRLGYQVSVDGAYGPGTRRAILQFETGQGVVNTGNVTPELILALGRAPSPTKTLTKTSTVQKKGTVLGKSSTASSSTVTASGGLIYPLKSAYHSSASPIGNKDARVTFCIGKPTSYRSEFEALTIAADPSGLKKGLEYYDLSFNRTMAQVVKYGDICDPKVLEGHRADAAKYLDYLRPKPAVVKKTPAQLKQEILEARANANDAREAYKKTHSSALADAPSAPISVSSSNGFLEKVEISEQDLRYHQSRCARSYPTKGAREQSTGKTYKTTTKEDCIKKNIAAALVDKNAKINHPDRIAWRKAQYSLTSSGKPITYANMLTVLPKALATTLTQKGKAFQAQCEFQTSYAAQHDCSCLKGKYLEKRSTESDFLKMKETQMKLAIQHQCWVRAGSVKHAYDGCMTRFNNPATRGYDFGPRFSSKEGYCACFGEEYANRYGAVVSEGKREIDRYIVSKISTDSYASCR